MKSGLSKFLSLIIASGSLWAQAAPLCPQVHSTQKPKELAAPLRSEGQTTLPESFYLQLRKEIANWAYEFADGKKFDKLMLSDRAFDPSHRYSDGKSLYELAERADWNGFLTRRLIKAGLNPYAKGANGKNILIELLEKPDRKISHGLGALLSGGEKTNPEDGLRFVRPEDFMVLDAQGHIVTNWLKNLTQTELDFVVQSAKARFNEPMLKYFIEEMGMKSLSAHSERTLLQELLDSRIETSQIEMQKSDEQIRNAIVKYELDVNEPFGSGSGYPRRIFLRTPLSSFIERHVEPSVIELLLERGARTDIVDSSGLNAMEWAVYIRSKTGDGRYVEILKNHGVPMPSILRQIFQKKPQ